VRRSLTSLSLPPAALPPGQTPVCAARIDNLIVTSGVPGIDPRTGQLPAEPEAQFANAFENLQAVLEQAGSNAGDIGLLTIWTPDRTGRKYINAPWLATFPDEHDRPARKTNHAPLPQGLEVQVSAIAVTGADRTSLGIPGLSHKDPLPMGARVGRYVFSSVFAPEDPANGRVVEGALAQIRRVFDNGALLMQQAGGSEDNINHYWVFMQDFAWQPAMVDHWVNRWPDFGDRPARKTGPYEMPIGTEIQTQLTAVLGARRRNYEVPGVGHHDPIPMGSSCGPLLQSSGIYGIDPADGKVVEGRDRQTDMVIHITRGLLEQAGATPDDVVGLTVMVQSFQDVPYFRERLRELFGEEKNGPALHFIRYPMPEKWHVQFHVTAVLP
jgi:2-iminobutanoate/2-iminopropanoate deaminase